VQEQIVGTLIILLLLGLAAWFGRRQVQTLRDTRSVENLPSEDRRYVRRQAWRRLVGCALMVVLAGLLAGWYLLGFHEFANQLRAQAEATPSPVERTPEQERALRFCAYYLIISLLTLLAMLGVAALDFWAIRVYALRHHRQIMADRRAMIERQVARLRQEGNGRDE
jgi:hypothetical protein